MSASRSSPTIGINQGWPLSRTRSTGRSSSVNWLIAPDLHWIDNIPTKNTFQSIFQKVHKNYPWIGWSRIFLVPLAIPDHRLARWMLCCDMFSYYCVTIKILGLIDALPSICESLTMVMVHCVCTCDTQLWHFVLVSLVTLSPTGRSRVSEKFSGWSQSKTSWPPLT